MVTPNWIREFQANFQKIPEEAGPKNYRGQFNEGNLNEYCHNLKASSRKHKGLFGSKINRVLQNDQFRLQCTKMHCGKVNFKGVWIFEFQTN